MTDLNYPILFGETQNHLDAFLQANDYTQIAILVDSNTKKFCLPLLNIPSDAIVIEIKDGELYKTWDTCDLILSKLIDEHFDRKSLIINLGGGVVGDIGGFCASIYMRGIDFVQIPTTLLSQVDSSVGGKTGIDFREGKNIIGSFYEPKLVIIDSVFLESLPQRQIFNGFAEVYKHALIHSFSYWELVREWDGSLVEISEIIEQSIKIKSAIVSKDYRESGIRKHLNFGHTIGHAIESYYLNYEEPYFHGEAIVIGIICELFLSQNMLGFDEDLDGVSNLFLSKYQLRPIPKEDYNNIFDLMLKDKKNHNSQIHSVLLRSIGDPVSNQIITEELIGESFDYFNALITK